ncbi:FMN-binding negative transcriptional regulator [Nakamurella deserti]|uniref:FMN-binding negative transcriptional regulator n=1 Tax=Nakamurella deserti TaxID=2164074 RepID=UPI000DBE4DA2|nr:FMN-binding negative transcriptional regulator [Nakamurella deserti]
MYVPHFNALDDEAALRAMVAAVGSAQLVTVGADGYPRATLLPVIWTGDTVVCHLARANPHWREIADDSPALLVVSGPQAYVSPSWYPAKAEHGRVVPTWNYAAVQLTGRARVHHDPEWLRQAVDELVTRHEASRPDPWSSADAPDRYITGQLRAIVGVEITVEGVIGKEKYSQNRSAADRRGVADGLAGEDDADAAEIGRIMASRLDGPESRAPEAVPDR